MKILITSPYSKNGGVRSFVDNIFPHLDNAIKFYRGNREEKGKVVNILLTLITPIRFLFYLLRKNPDRVIVNTSLSKQLLVRDGILVFLSKVLGYNVTLMIHGFQDKALFHDRILKMGYFKADVIFVLASEFKQQLVTAGYRRNIYVNYNPVESAILNRIDEIQISRDMSEINKLLFLARVEKNKGVYILLEAFELLQKKYPSLILTIAGDGSELDNMKSYVANHQVNNVVFKGFVSGEAKIKLLEESDLFIMPTHREGLPISVLEAMALGNMIVTRPVGGLVDLYDNHKFGTLIESLDPKDYAAAIEVLINDIDLEEQRKNNILFAKDNFSAQKIVAKILNSN